MTRRTDRLWRLLAERPGTAGTLADWRELLGEAFDLAMPLLKPTGDHARAWACGKFGRVGCHREVHGRGDHLVAVCGEQPRRCDRVRLRHEDLVLYVLDPRRLGRALLNGQVDLDGEVAPMNDGWVLGSGRFGEEVVSFHLGFTADAGVLLAARRTLQERWPRRRVVLLVPQADQVDVATRAVLKEMDALVLALDESMRDAHALVVDLAEVITHFRFAGVDLGSLLAHRYDLILDPMGNRYWLYGKLITFKQRARFPQRLLAALAKTPSSLVTRAELFGQVWPDEYGARGVEKDWGRALRDQVTALKAAMDLDDERYPIAAHRSGDDAEGGYLVRLDPRRVHWWSGPLE